MSQICNPRKVKGASSRLYSIDRVQEMAALTREQYRVPDEFIDETKSSRLPIKQAKCVSRADVGRSLQLSSSTGRQTAHQALLDSTVSSISRHYQRHNPKLTFSGPASQAGGQRINVTDLSLNEEDDVVKIMADKKRIGTQHEKLRLRKNVLRPRAADEM